MKSENPYLDIIQEIIVEAFPMSVCMSLYKMEVINRFNLRFKKILSEDTIFNIAAIVVQKQYLLFRILIIVTERRNKLLLQKVFLQTRRFNLKNF